MAKTQNHECEGTKGHKYLEKNGEGGPPLQWGGLTQTYVVAWQTTEKRRKIDPWVLLWEKLWEKSLPSISSEQNTTSLGCSTFVPINKIHKVDWVTFLPTGVLWGTLSNSWTMFISNSSKDSKSWGKGGNVSLPAVHTGAMFCLSGSCRSLSSTPA